MLKLLLTFVWLSALHNAHACAYIVYSIRWLKKEGWKYFCRFAFFVLLYNPNINDLKKIENKNYSLTLQIGLSVLVYVPPNVFVFIFLSRMGCMIEW